MKFLLIFISSKLPIFSFPQCDGNVFQSCALYLYPSPDEQVDIMICSMRPHHFYGDCIDEMDLDGKKLYECMNGTLGTTLQLFAEEETLKVVNKILGVPAVLFDQYSDPMDPSLSLTDFENVVKKNHKFINEKLWQ